jgi:hypothetical protein
MRFYSPRSVPRRRSKTSTLLNAKSMIPFLARGKVSNCEIKETGCMWPSRPRHMCALPVRLLPAARGSSSDPDPSFTRTCVSCTISVLSHIIREPDATSHQNLKTQIKTSGRGSGARHPECAAWRARLDEGHSVDHETPDDESGGFAGADADDAFEGRDCRIC